MERPERLSDEDVMALLDSKLEGLYHAEEEVKRVMGWAAMRGLIPSDAHLDQHTLSFDREDVPLPIELPANVIPLRRENAKRKS